MRRFPQRFSTTWVSRLAAACAALCVCCTAFAADWPQFLGPARNGVSLETGLLASWPKSGPAVIWEKEIGDGFSGPVVSGEQLILFHRVGDNEVVECLEAATGKERWKHAYACDYHDDFGKGDGPRSTPAISGKKVYTLGAAGELRCLDLDSGAKIWSRSLAADYRPRKGFFGVATSPLVEGNLLLINVGASGAGIVAFDTQSGKDVWKATDQEASYASPVAATIDGVRHVFFFTREGLVSLDPATGTVHFSKRWRSRMNASVNAATPLVDGDQLFLSASYGTGAVLLRVGKSAADELWASDEVLSNHYSTSIKAGDFLFGCDGRQEEGARLRCVEWKTGKARWTKEGFGCASFILAEEKIIALTENGDLVLLSATPEEYRELARATVLKKTCRAQIALANGRLYGRDNSKLVCWNLKK